MTLIYSILIILAKTKLFIAQIYFIHTSYRIRYTVQLYSVQL